MSSLNSATLVIVIMSLVIAQEVETHCSGRRLAVEAATIDCPGKCNYRCSKASRHKMCLRACNACCQRCNCVPPGTSGNKDHCPCYVNMATHGGRHKCP